MTLDCFTAYFIASRYVKVLIVSLRIDNEWKSQRIPLGGNTNKKPTCFNRDALPKSDDRL